MHGREATREIMPEEFETRAQKSREKYEEIITGTREVFEDYTQKTREWYNEMEAQKQRNPR